MRKRGDMSMNIIVIAALALLVLVVLAIIFTSRIGTFGKGVDSCDNSGGECVAAESCRAFTDDAGNSPYGGENIGGTAGGRSDQNFGPGYKCCLKNI